MKLALIGRTETLLAAGHALRASGHSIDVVVTARPAPEYRAGYEEFEAAAAAWGAAFVATGRLQNAHAELAARGPIDLGISVNYPSVISQESISQFRLGILNAHGGDLPRYRGNACQAWAILNGESRIGLCVHQMVGGELDSGDIIARDYLPIDLSTKVTAVHQWMEARVPELFTEAAARLQSDPTYILERQSKDPRHALRCYPRRPEDGRIDWRADAVSILRLINACNRPYAGAFCDFEGNRLVVWDAVLADDENFCAIPGQVTRFGEHEVDVATGRGKVTLREVELDGSVGPARPLFSSLRQRLG